MVVGSLGVVYWGYSIGIVNPEPGNLNQDIGFILNYPVNQQLILLINFPFIITFSCKLSVLDIFDHIFDIVKD